MQHLCASLQVLQTKDLRAELNPLDATLTQNRGEGPHGRTTIPVRYLDLSLFFATLRKAPGVCGYSSHFGSPLSQWPTLANSKIPARSGLPVFLPWFPFNFQLSTPEKKQPGFIDRCCIHVLLASRPFGRGGPHGNCQADRARIGIQDWSRYVRDPRIGAGDIHGVHYHGGGESGLAGPISGARFEAFWLGQGIRSDHFLSHMLRPLRRNFQRHRRSYLQSCGGGGGGGARGESVVLGVFQSFCCRAVYIAPPPRRERGWWLF